jgi:two-component system, cell cycle response regulator CpdR
MGFLGACTSLGCYRRVTRPLTILFVDDDLAVLSIVAEALSARGFRVLATDKGDEALRLLAQEPVDVLFADIVMPDMNGIELVKRAKLVRPNLKVLLETGYFSRAAEARSFGKLVFKPLRVDQIEGEIRSLLPAA